MLSTHPSERTDYDWMQLALEQARKALFIANPNPRVGCVIVKDGQLLALGFTQAAGQAHAEVMAIRHAQAQGLSLAGSTFYVTLEPCSHHGRTPPCVEAILAVQPARVVVALSDPNPKVSGQGLARLRAAGIQVSAGVCAGQSLALNPGFVARMVCQQPWVWLKTAASLDGKTALPDGRSQWITGPLARADGHHWRARSCVVLTGVGTVVADNPQMTVRDVATERQPQRAIVDSDLSTPPGSSIFEGPPVWVFTCSTDAAKTARLRERNARIIVLPQHAGRVCLPSLMRWLAENEVNEVHVEAGATLGGALLEAGCVDELLVYLAPALLGQGMGMFRLPLLQNLDQARRFQFVEALPVGEDMRLLLRQPDSWARLASAVGLSV